MVSSSHTIWLFSWGSSCDYILQKNIYISHTHTHTHTMKVCDCSTSYSGGLFDWRIINSVAKPFAAVGSTEHNPMQYLSQNRMSIRSGSRHISASNVLRRLCDSGLHCRIAAMKPLLKDTNNKKRLAWAKKHEQWTLDRWVQIRDFWFQPPCVIVRRSWWTDDICMCGFHRKAWRRCDGVGMLCWWQWQWFVYNSRHT